MGMKDLEEDEVVEKQKEDRIAKRKARALKFKEIKSNSVNGGAGGGERSNFQNNKRPSNYNNYNKNTSYNNKPFNNSFKPKNSKK